MLLFEMVQVFQITNFSFAVDFSTVDDLKFNQYNFSAKITYLYIDLINIVRSAPYVNVKCYSVDPIAESFYFVKYELSIVTTKILIKILSNENKTKKTGVSKKIVCFI